jgi:hypothetical protein
MLKKIIAGVVISLIVAIGSTVISNKVASAENRVNIFSIHKKLDSIDKKLDKLGGW